MFTGEDIFCSLAVSINKTLGPLGMCLCKSYSCDSLMNTESWGLGICNRLCSFSHLMKGVRCMNDIIQENCSQNSVPRITDC